MVMDERDNNAGSPPKDRDCSYRQKQERKPQGRLLSSGAGTGLIQAGCLKAILERCYTCIDDSDKIFDCCLLRNSAPTMPFILVPSGSPFFPISAHALSSNLTTIPSFRCTFFAARTMIACLMSPLLTLFPAAADVLPGPLSPIERDFCTTTIIRSP